MRFFRSWTRRARCARRNHHPVSRCKQGQDRDCRTDRRLTRFWLICRSRTDPASSCRMLGPPTIRRAGMGQPDDRRVGQTKMGANTECCLVLPDAGGQAGIREIRYNLTHGESCRTKISVLTILRCRKPLHSRNPAQLEAWRGLPSENHRFGDPEVSEYLTFLHKTWNGKNLIINKINRLKTWHAICV